MQKLQLYISGERIDLFKDEQVSISLSQQDYKDPSKIFTEFTKTFTIPASKTNNKIFSHYYNFNITNGFDARDKVEASIELNDIPYKQGFVALNGVELKNNKAYAYKVTFYGNTINLNKIFRDDDLTVLSGQLDDAYGLVYNYQNIEAKLQGTVGDVIIAPLITHTEQLFYNSNASVQTAGNLNYINGQHHGVMWDELKFAIKVSTVIDAIETYYGAVGFNLPAFSDDFFGNVSNTQFNNLYLWLHRKKGKVEPTQQLAYYSTQVSIFERTQFTQYEDATTVEGGTTIVLFLEPNLYNNLDLFVLAADAAIPYYVTVISSTQGILWTSTVAAGSRSFSKADFGTLAVGSYYVEVWTETAMTFTNVTWDFSSNALTPDGNFGWTATYQTNPLNVSARYFNATIEFDFLPSQQIPTIKVIDFMNGLFKMFNLTAYYDNQPLLVNGNTNTDFGKIKIQTLDEFYSTNFNTWDISEYISVDKSQVNVGLPYTEIAFGYEGVQTLLALTFSKENSTSWGALKYSGGERLTGPNTSYTISLPFEHMQFERLFDQANSNSTTIQYGRFVNDNQESYLGKPLLFYPIKQTNGTEISFLRTSSSHVALDDYIIPSNSRLLDPAVSTENINFNAEVNEYTGASGFTGTLFANYYDNYISDVFNLQRRITKVTAYLPLNMIYKLQMNDVMTINNQDYIINTANINLISGKATLELLNKV